MALDGADTARWYLVQCKARQCGRAYDNLCNQSFDCYRPVREVETIKSGKRVRAAEPLFAGYVFIRLTRLQHNWHSIRSTRGVLRLVSFADDPVPVADQIVDEIKRRLAGHSAQPLYKEGALVTVKDGPFKDLEAIFSKADGDERAIILLTLLQRQHKLAVPVSMISPSG